MHKKIKISDIENAKNKQLNFNFDGLLDDIDSIGTVKADLLLESMGEFIKLSGHVYGIVLLTCDLCLKQYEYKLNFDVNEMFAKDSLYDAQSGKETEIKDGEFVTDLEGADEIDISDVLYQSVILDFPNKKVCDINCNGGDIFIREDENSSNKEIDPRMAIFKDIKIDRK